MKKILFSVLTLLLSFEVLACSCQFHGLLAKWQRAEHVFIADVTKLTTIEKGDTKNYREGKVRGDFTVISRFKGQPELITHLSSAHKPVCCTCSTTLKNDKYVVFTNKTGELLLSSCSMTMLLSHASYYEEVLTRLSAGSETQQFVGQYNSVKRVLTLNESEARFAVHEFYFDFEVTHNDVVFEGYQLKDGSIFFTRVNTVTPIANE